MEQVVGFRCTTCNFMVNKILIESVISALREYDISKKEKGYIPTIELLIEDLEQESNKSNE